MAEGLYRDGYQAGVDAAIRASNMGGLNTESSPLNMPHNDSPILDNCVVTIGGNIQKRRGTKILQVTTSSSPGQSMYSMTTPQGNSFVIRKEGTSLTVGVYRGGDESNITTLVGHTNVFTSSASSALAKVVDISSDGEPRYLFLCARNVPIQLTAVEVSGNTGANPTSLNTTDPRMTEAVSVPGAVIFVVRDTNGSVSTGVCNGASTSMGTHTFTFSPGSIGAGTTDLIYVPWSWWAEAYWFDGDRFYYRAPRFGATASDRHIALPERLRDGLSTQRLLPGSGNPMIVAHRRLNTADTQPYTWNVGIPTNTDYTLTDGSPGYMSQNYMFNTVRGTTHITFGGHSIAGFDTTPQTASPTHIHRIRELKFRGNTNWRADKTAVVSGYKSPTNWGTASHNWAAGSTPAAGEYAWNSWSGVSGVHVSTPAAYNSKFVGFSVGGDSTGIPQTSLVKFMHYDTDWKGSNALETQVPYRNRGAVPAYGLGEIADYRLGFFPTCGAIQDGRLFLSGFPHRPLTVLSSAILDVNVPGEYYQDFWIDPFTGIDGARDYESIPTDTDDFVVGMVSLSGSLFVYTRKSVQRYRPDGAGGLRPEIVGSRGLTNPSGLCLFRDRMLFTSDDGLYECRNMEGLADNYGLVEVSTKVSRLFREGPNSHVVNYDSITSQLYITMGDYALVYQSELGCFYKFILAGRWDILFAVEVVDINRTKRFVLTTRAPDSEGTKVYLLQTEYEYYLDMVRNTSLWASAVKPHFPSFSTTTTANVRIYQHNLITTGMDDVEDMQVTLGGDVLEFGTEWRKRRGFVYLTAMPNPGTSLEVVHLNPTTKTTTHLTQIENRTDSGFPYLSRYTTPVFTWNMLANFKRLLHFEALFDNSVQNGWYDLGQVVNTSENEFWVGFPKVRLDCNISFILDHQQGGETSYDLYRFYDLVWDYSLFDVTGSVQTADDYVLIRTAIQGIGYAFQAMVWNWDVSAFSLTGYQLKGNIKPGSKYRRE
jgi:hypothetical protein